MSDEVLEKKKELVAVLQRVVNHERWLAQLNQRTAMILMFLAICASAGAGLAGLSASEKISKQMIGMIALLPGFLALLATTINFDGRARWHYRKKREIDTLLGRLKFEMPSSPSDDQIALIHREKARIDKELDDAYDKEFVLSWKWTGAGQHGGGVQ
jgi:hypothetical protein